MFKEQLNGPLSKLRVSTSITSIPKGRILKDTL